MTEEEKILKYLNTMKVIDFDKLGFVYAKKTINDVLDLIKKQQSELEKKDKMIEEISKNPYNELKVNGILFTGTDIKQYFERKVIPEEK